MSYRHVMAAIDLSEESEQVLTAAQSVASEHGAKLSLVTAIKPLAQVYGGLDMVPVTQGSVSFEREAEEKAHAQLVEIGKKLGVAEADAHVKIGPPAAEIRETAEAHDVDLIVIGTHGRHGLGLLLGSTATGVLHGVNCDVLTVRIK